MGREQEFNRLHANNSVLSGWMFLSVFLPCFVFYGGGGGGVTGLLAASVLLLRARHLAELQRKDSEYLRLFHFNYAAFIWLSLTPAAE